MGRDISFHRPLGAALAVVFAAFFLMVPARAGVLVFAAASLTDFAQAAAQRFTQDTGTEVSIATGGSSSLARQIAAGAPAAIFLSANKSWVDHTVEMARFTPPLALFGNRLVIAAPKNGGGPVTLAQLPGALGQNHLAVADPAHVPAGIYARQALEAAGIWPVLKDRLAPARDVRAALALIEAGAAPYGIIYATDARGRAVRIAGGIDAALHEPIISYGALSPEATAGAKAFFTFLSGPQGQQIAAGFGFTAIPGADHSGTND